MIKASFLPIAVPIMSRPTRTLPPTPVDALTETDPGEPLTDIAYRRIKAAILDGSLPPSLLVSEHQIATRLAMSRTPVHQAIVRLEQEGWIELLPRRGLLIAPVSAPDMLDVYEALLALEVAAVGRLTSRLTPENDPALLELEQACDDADAALEEGDLPGWAAADDRFHALLVDLSGNRHIARLARSVMEQAQRARLLTLKLRPRPNASNADHRAILEAIKARDQDLACARMRAHRQRGMDVLLPILEALSTKTGFLHGS
jgi:DNA-binding GntR family transcriptional regulator